MCKYVVYTLMQREIFNEMPGFVKYMFKLNCVIFTIQNNDDPTMYVLPIRINCLHVYVTYVLIYAAIPQ